jgi:hypothetical protein
VTTATMDAHQRATSIAEAHPGWVVWVSRAVATRALHVRPDPSDDVFAQTVCCDTWQQLEDALAEQDDNDRAWGRR